MKHVEDARQFEEEKHKRYEKGDPRGGQFAPGEGGGGEEEPSMNDKNNDYIKSLGFKKESTGARNELFTHPDFPGVRVYLDDTGDNDGDWALMDKDDKVVDSGTGLKSL